MLNQRGQGWQGPPLSLTFCPERVSFDPYLAVDLSLFSMRRHRFVATLELLPFWLRFLHSRNLLTAEEHREASDDLQPLGEAVELLKRHQDAPGLGDGMVAWEVPLEWRRDGD